MTAQLQIYTLGGSRFLLEGEDFQQFSTRKVEALAIYLASSGRPQPREVLADLLWDDRSQTRALSNLRVALSNLRKHLGSYFTITRDSAALNPEADVWLDAVEMESLLAEGKAGSDERTRADINQIEAAVALYQGEFLQGFSVRGARLFEEWVTVERERLHYLVMDGLSQVMQWCLAHEDYAAGIQQATRWLQLDPLNEAAHQSLMRLLAYDGQIGAALRQYQECVRLLDEELGLVPSPETTELYEAIQRRQLTPPVRRTIGVAADAELSSKPGEPPVNEQTHHDGDEGHLYFGRPMEQQIRFCTAPDGVRISYATAGEGPPLVRAATFLTHLEYDWNSPIWRHWLEGLANHHTLIRYDQRGCGLSDWDVEDFSLYADVQDLETVVDTLGVNRFPLIGISQSGPVAIAYAVRHPEKVSHLILYGSYARGFLKRKSTPQQLEEADMYLKLVKLGWGRDNPAFRQVFTTGFLPEGTPEQTSWFNELQRKTTSPKNAASRIRASFDLDVSDLARKVTVPTLVVHARNDARCPYEQGLELAALIPNARLVSLDSNNHILLATEPAWPRFLAELHKFVGAQAT